MTPSNGQNSATFADGSNCCAVLDIDHVHFYVGNAKLTADYYCSQLGFSKHSYSGLETGNRRRAAHVLQQNDIYFVFSSPISGTAEDSEEFYKYLHTHGESVQDVALRVTNVQAAYERAIANGAKSVREPSTLEDEHGRIEVAVVQSPFGDWVHTLIDRSKYNNSSSSSSTTNSIPFLPGFMKTTTTNATTTTTANQHPFATNIDHIAIAVENNTVHSVLEWYKKAFGLERFISNDDEDGESGIVISSENTGMVTMVLSSPQIQNRLKFVFVEPRYGKKKSQIQEFLDFHGGPGIAHIALYTPDIIQTVSKLRSAGLGFITVPHTYYDDWKQKEGYERVQEDWNSLRSLEILVDGNAHYHNKQQLIEQQQDFEYLLQTFTLPLSDRPTFYLEFICRRGANGFGAGNITSLFRAMEKLQEARGTL